MKLGLVLPYDSSLRTLPKLMCLNESKRNSKFPWFLDFYRVSIDEATPKPMPTRKNTALEVETLSNQKEMIINRHQVQIAFNGFLNAYKDHTRLMFVQVNS